MQSDERYYEIADKEFANSPRQGLLIKCKTESIGDNNQTKALYIKARVGEMKNENTQKIKTYRAENNFLWVGKLHDILLFFITILLLERSISYHDGQSLNVAKCILEKSGGEECGYFLAMYASFPLFTIIPLTILIVLSFFTRYKFFPEKEMRSSILANIAGMHLFFTAGSVFALYTYWSQANKYASYLNEYPDSDEYLLIFKNACEYLVCLKHFYIPIFTIIWFGYLKNSPTVHKDSTQKTAVKNQEKNLNQISDRDNLPSVDKKYGSFYYEKLRSKHISNKTNQTSKTNKTKKEHNEHDPFGFLD